VSSTSAPASCSSIADRWLRRAAVSALVFAAVATIACGGRPGERAQTLPGATPAPGDAASTPPAVRVPSDTLPADARAGPALAAGAGTDAAPPKQGDAAFASTVASMLARNCSPCHVQGGKLYARLPFDDPAVVLEHKDAILRRLKTDEDKWALEDWAGSRY
jgi:hypothetical protein